MTTRDTSAAMPERAISVRLDAEASAALDELVASGLSQSEAIRKALIDAAGRRVDRVALATEAAMLAADEDDLREVARIRAFMDDLSGPR
jgi:Arc/MetJ-type ribon-helix-helix transcriptional regulator